MNSVALGTLGVELLKCIADIFSSAIGKVSPPSIEELRDRCTSAINERSNDWIERARKDADARADAEAEKTFHEKG